MQALGVFVFFALALAVIGFAIWLFFAMVRAVVSPKTYTQPRLGSDMTAEEESYVHDGPYGYSPNTAYPQTQYGSGFNPDAKWNTERHDHDDFDEGEWR